MEAPPPYSERDATTLIPIASTLLFNSRSQNSLHEDVDLGEGRDSVEEVDAFHTQASRNNATHHDHVVSSSAAAFFESRPAALIATSTPTTYKISVAASTRPNDLVYPASLRLHDVLESDWLTFINFLLPDHILNEEVTGRGNSNRSLVGKERENGLPGHERHGTSDDTCRLTTHAAHESDSIGKFDTTVMDWNRGFFHPRGLHIVVMARESDRKAVPAALSDMERPSRATGAWIPYDHEIIGESSSAGRRRGFFKGFHNSSYGGFRMGPIIADNEGIRMGSIFRADQKGLRFGGSKGIVADDNGLSMGGRSLFKRETSEVDREQVASPVRRVEIHRSASVSSFYSSATEDSSDSECSSCGSLPDYEDLTGRQLMVMRQCLPRLLYQLDQPMTKATVSQICDEIASSRNLQVIDHEQDFSVLRNEVKDLLRVFRDRKRKQRVESRRIRHERRALHRSRRNERRLLRREARRVRQEPRRAEIGSVETWPTYHTSSELLVARPQPPHRPPLTHVPGLPVARAASVPLLRPNLCGISAEMPSTEHARFDG